jgi:hypothetical protein
MKQRTGFVSNSSSSSFIINKENLTYEQLDSIRRHIEIGKKIGIEYTDPEDAWSITETEKTISGETRIVNFRMDELFHVINIDDKYITWTD